MLLHAASGSGELRSSSKFAESSESGSQTERSNQFRSIHRFSKVGIESAR